ncbi:phosphoribosyl-ATP diphosphatase [Nitrosovibrio sp. Nv17]|jgi:phosphoribosyl-ATP pyrophosphohydrolase|uniref:phosphoribosyl-ATP diphosphatase n=1 Tax=Nitrosovibrio sp. Nv17 TaxID=1855339 RepID=UPI0009089321|nr:phosphoribosyl-ATP diphosphatase [Nitrosovibrio sp. Nv17]SFW24508.1 phosphoribosyl-ATP pyrophosphatase [Nitrosovibrio sp. Nv17]
MTHSTLLDRLAATIDARRHADPAASYVASLLHAGEDKILRKLLEEATEVLLASKGGNSHQVVREMADLWFHCLVLLAHHRTGPSDVLEELLRREGVSGVDEKASRTTE